MSVKLIYKDIAVGADTDASVTATESLWSTISLVPFGSYNDKNYITLEQNHWILDGSFESYDGGDISFMSNEMSDEDCVFANPPTITIAFDNRYTSLGINLTFRKYWASEVVITWYQGATQLAQQTFYPDSESYFCQKTVNAYDKVLIVINKTSLPHRRIQLDSVMFGIVRTFERKDLRDGSASITQEVDITSRQIAINTMDWTLSSKENVEYIFQLKQPVEAYDDNTLIGVFYISKSDRKSGSVYDIECSDAIGIMDDEPFADAVYTNRNALTLAQDICSPFEVEMDAALQSKTVSGILKDCTKRTALQQLCFAIGAVADTSGTNKVKIFQLPSVSKPIPENRTRIDGNVKTDAIVTEVRLMSHSYSTSVTTNQVEINGTKYGDTQNVVTITNPDVTAVTKPNVIEVTDATLISPSNVQEIAQRLYDLKELRSTHNVSFRVVDEAVGDKLETLTPWETDFEGYYSKASITLSGITVSDAEVVGT